MQETPIRAVAVAEDLAGRLRADGFAFVPAARMRAALEARGPLADWDAFAASWDDLALDTYMADRGRYRRRRHAVYHLGADGALARLPHRPHYQSLDYNPLNGGVERWFEPVPPGLGEGSSIKSIFAACFAVFGAVEDPPADGWSCELHQFRIEALPGAPGQPTPEGMHRDGVDHVLVLLVRRTNVRSGTTLIGVPGQPLAGSFTLVEPFDAAWVEDRRVHHGVTAVEAMDPALPAWRDVLVVTLRRMDRPPG
jgi:hypothetical protein